MLATHIIRGLVSGAVHWVAACVCNASTKLPISVKSAHIVVESSGGTLSLDIVRVEHCLGMCKFAGSASLSLLHLNGLAQQSVSEPHEHSAQSPAIAQ